MQTEEKYRLSLYQDLGMLDGKKHIRIVRNTLDGTICVKKIIPATMQYIYEYLKCRSNPYIPEIYECIIVEDTLIVVEEYIQGRTLEDITRDSHIGEAEAVRIMLELCRALQMLHNARSPIICRDLKAENVMIDNKGCVKIIDFSIARTYQSGKRRDTALMGTAEYAAPEQFGFFQTDNRTDIYSLGVLINYIMTGKFPVEQIVQGRMSEIVRKCTCLDPKERYQSVEEVTKAVEIKYPEYCVNAQNESSIHKSFVPPGFRSKTLWKMLVATVGYLLITYVCFTMEMNDGNLAITGIQLRFEQFALWISQLVFIGLVFDYRGWKKLIPLHQNQSTVVRIVGVAATYIMLVVAAASICVIAEMIFL